MSKIKLGMVGGGKGSFIGEVHRMAARLDDRYELLAGALSSDANTAKESALSLNLDKKRSYSSFDTMAEVEASLEDGIEAVAIVTPNHLHAQVAEAFLNNGIHVICDKPLTSSLADAEGLASIVKDTGLVFAVTYNYSGYPMVRQAREMIQNGDLGELRVIQIEYAQGWLATDIEKTGHKQALWRTNPAKAGIGGAIGDIGTHAFHLSEFVTGLQVKDLLADLDSMVSGRELDDNANILMKYTNDVKGMLWVSQIATGKENGLRIRVFGTKAGIEWSQENPNFLKYSRLGESLRILSRGGPSIGCLAGEATRIPSGHPEGFIEGFANIYSDTADLIIAHRSNSKTNSLVPTINDGIRGMQFIETAVKSSTSGGVWLSFGS